MSTTIFTFDHGQKKMSKAIGVEDTYLDELADKCKEVITNVVFDENQKIRDEISPSQFVEIVANDFSYSQIVVMASYFLESKLDNIMEQMKQLNTKIKSIVLSGDDMPQELKDLLDKLTSEMDKQDGDGDDDIGTDAFPYKVNAVSIMNFNSDLKNLCNATGGKQIEITDDLRVYTHSLDVGRQEIKI